MKINSIFTKNNKLKISIFDSQYKHGDFKICFSLIYSIQEIDGGIISKKVGRYYEIHSEQNEVIFTLQEPRIGSYNLSCGPEGLFVIGKNNQIIECEISSLKFENPIPQISYSDDYDNVFDPVIPLPNIMGEVEEVCPFAGSDIDGTYIIIQSITKVICISLVSRNYKTTLTL